MLAKKMIACVLAAAALGASAQAWAREQPYILGADISWVPEDEAAGAEYWDKGEKKDIFDILESHGFNAIRLRVFVNPAAPGGYAAGKSEAWCDLDHVKAMAKRAAAHHMKLLISIHYADTWTNPESQPKPAAWKDLPFDDLVKAVRKHTHDVVAGLKDQGTPASMVALGNEATHGILWPDGRVWSQIPSGNPVTDAANSKNGPGLGHYDQFATLLKAAAEEAKADDPNVKIMVHHSLGRSKDRVLEWLEELTKREVPFDVIGLSCYAQRNPDDWKNTLTEVSQKYLNTELCVTEYSGQKRLLNDLTFEVTNEMGIGTFLWEPTRHREALFDKDGVNAGGGANAPILGATPATAPAATQPASHGGKYVTNQFIDLYPKMAKDYGITDK